MISRNNEDFGRNCISLPSPPPFYHFGPRSHAFHKFCSHLRLDTSIIYQIWLDFVQHLKREKTGSVHTSSDEYEKMPTSLNSHLSNMNMSHMNYAIYMYMYQGSPCPEAVLLRWRSFYNFD
jgi:hypothetical protein